MNRNTKQLLQTVPGRPKPAPAPTIRAPRPDARKRARERGGILSPRPKTRAVEEEEEDEDTEASPASSPDSEGVVVEEELFESIDDYELLKLDGKGREELGRAGTGGRRDALYGKKAESAKTGSQGSAETSSAGQKRKRGLKISSAPAAAAAVGEDMGMFDEWGSQQTHKAKVVYGSSQSNNIHAKPSQEDRPRQSPKRSKQGSCGWYISRGRMLMLTLR